MSRNYSKGAGGGGGVISSSSNNSMNSGRGRGRGGGGGGRGVSQHKRRTDTPEALASRLYVGGLDARVNEGVLLKLFSQFDGLVSIHFAWHQSGEKKGQHRGFAFAQYNNADSAQSAARILHGRMLAGRSLVVRLAEDKDKEGEEKMEDGDIDDIQAEKRRKQDPTSLSHDPSGLNLAFASLDARRKAESLSRSSESDSSSSSSSSSGSTGSKSLAEKKIAMIEAQLSALEGKKKGQEDERITTTKRKRD